MVGNYRLAEEKILAAFKLLREAQEGCTAAFQASDYDFQVVVEFHSKRIALDEPQTLMFQWKKRAWSRLVEKMGIRKAMSIKRAAELDAELESGKNLPEITEANILAMVEKTMDDFPQMVQEAVKEVYERLRPRSERYKTNDYFEVGRRVILSNRVRMNYNGKFDDNHYHHQEMNALDNVFHMLDGKGIPPGYDGPLLTAIKQTGIEGKGATEYFRFQCYAGNGNLHLEFLRLDLVARLNQVAGGGQLRKADETRKAA